jgi:hypothetical protein
MFNDVFLALYIGKTPLAIAAPNSQLQVISVEDLIFDDYRLCVGVKFRFLCKSSGAELFSALIEILTASLFKFN